MLYFFHWKYIYSENLNYFISVDNPFISLTSWAPGTLIPNHPLPTRHFHLLLASMSDHWTFPFACPVVTVTSGSLCETYNSSQPVSPGLLISLPVLLPLILLIPLSEMSFASVLLSHCSIEAVILEYHPWYYIRPFNIWLPLISPSLISLH